METITKETLANTKLRVNSPEESRKVQELAKQLGYQEIHFYRRNDGRAPFLFFHSGEIHEGIVEDWFISSPLDELEMADLFPAPGQLSDQPITVEAEIDLKTRLFQEYEKEYAATKPGKPYPQWLTDSQWEWIIRAITGPQPEPTPITPEALEGLVGTDD